MREEANYYELRQLDYGDIVQCTDEKEYEFLRLKRTKFVGKHDGVFYDVPIKMFKEVVRKAIDYPFDIHSLQEGDLFYTLNNKLEATIFRFKYMINANRVQAENPVTGGGYRIDSSLIKGNVKEFQR